MGTSFYAYRMHFNGSGTPVLSINPFKLHPGSRLNDKKSKDKIYLAGGFSSFLQQADVPLSPTLQINGDLGNFSTDDLQRIGLAELNRLNTTTFRSYIREPDNRVAILAEDADSLTHFLETYGSVLRLEPLLLNSYHPDYATPEELEIEALPDGCRIQYSVRKPVDLDKCTYCGACGPVCPEDCLNEHLFIDMSRCSYCNECVKICSSAAIDLYRMNKFDLVLQSIVLLDEPNLELPDNRSNIYTPDRLDTLFSSLVPISIEETISWASSCCQFSKRKNSGCSICLDACKHDALQQTRDRIVIDYKHCVECGACLSSCPTGALQFKRFTDQQFIEWLSTVRLKKNSTVIIGSEQELHRLWWKRNATGIDHVLFLEYPNIRALSAMHMLLLLSLGAKQIILLDKPASLANKPVGS